MKELSLIILCSSVSVLVHRSYMEDDSIINRFKCHFSAGKYNFQEEIDGNSIVMTELNYLIVSAI